MHRLRHRGLARKVSALALAVAWQAGVARERSEIPEAYTWNLKDLFPDDAAFESLRADASARVPRLAVHQGHLGDSAGALLAALDEVTGLRRDLSRLHVYAESRSNEDTRQNRPRELVQESQRLEVDLDAATAWIRPEILSIGESKVRTFLGGEPKLAPYRFFLEDTLRWRAHTRSGPEERIAALAGDLESAGSGTYGTLKDADLPYPTVKLSTGEVRLDPAAYTLYRASSIKADRDLVFDKFMGALKTYERTFGTTLDAHLKSHLFDAKVHEFGSALEAALFPDAIPVGVYAQLLSDVRRSLPTFHRFLGLRRRMLGLEKLRYQDLYVPTVDKVGLSFDPEQARILTLEAVAPLGAPYVAALKKGFESRWTDYLPSTGKREGAYSTGVYGVHPYQLLNFNGQYEDLSTLAHESGHSMHTFLAYLHQPFQTAEYSTFVAEVASTLNENLLLHLMLGKAKDDATRLALLGNALDTLRITLFRQALFADFELSVHQRAERGEPITGEQLSALYLKLLRDYYGHDAGVCQVDDVMAIEWAYIPHFYYDFYVYQYSTSIVASTSIARAIRDEARSGKTRARDAYLAMLSSGGSKYPVELLREAGVDMTTSKPFDAAIAEMNAIMDEMETILARRPKGTK
jgi:oligoendopeptidase F